MQAVAVDELSVQRGILHCQTLSCFTSENEALIPRELWHTLALS
jgi:hypothetical protein